MTETILRATDCYGSQVTVYPCALPTWGWQYTNPVRREFDYGWELSQSLAMQKALKMLKPDDTGKYPEFEVILLKTERE